MEKAAVPPPPHPGKPNSDYWHRSGEFYAYNFPFPKTNPLAAADQLRARRAYLACVRYSDRQVGKVLDALDTLGLDDSTIVVVWGDNGWHLGDSQLWGKHTPFERALLTPLIIRAPGISRAGTRCDALVESLDLYPTLMDLCQPGFTRTATSTGRPQFAALARRFGHSGSGCRRELLGESRNRPHDRHIASSRPATAATGREKNYMTCGKRPTRPRTSPQRSRTWSNDCSPWFRPSQAAKSIPRGESLRVSPELVRHSGLYA